MDRSLVSRILATTHSRIPVYRGKNKHDIAGLILVKLLVELDPSDCVPVSSIGVLPCCCIFPEAQQSPRAVTLSTASLYVLVGLDTIVLNRSVPTARDASRHTAAYGIEIVPERR